MVGYVLMSDMSFTVPQQYCDHQWTGWNVIEQPTCTSTGMEIRECTICGLGQSREIDRIPHNYTEWTITRQASCRQEGEMTRTCRLCGHQEWQIIDRLPHSFGDWVVTKQASCTEEGRRVITCRVCGYEEWQTINKLPHNFGPWTITKEPSCSAEGEQYHVCLTCGFKSTEPIARLPHDFEWTIIQEATDHSSGLASLRCKVCGYVEESGSFDPEGTLRRGDSGDAVRTVQKLLVDQNYLNADGVDGIYGGGTEKAILNFQNDQGLTPDGVAWPQTIQRLQHDFGPWKTVKKLTREEPGERVRTCKDCGYEQHESIELSPLFVQGSRGDDVRTVQQMLGNLGYSTGAYDGIYGTLLDAAYKAFAEKNNLKFEPGRITPFEIDQLVNSWIAAQPEENWMGAGGMGTPVDLALTITLVETDEEDQSDEIMTYSWSLTNMGSEPVYFTTLLMDYGEDPDFKKDNMVMAIDGVLLQPNCANSVSGSFMTSKDWGEGDPKFQALGVSDSNGRIWLSNTEQSVDELNSGAYLSAGGQ